jgi:hypothetical protein
MELIYTIAITLGTLAVLVAVHEYGHFWVARRCGVQVLRFSIGFGKSLYSWRDRQGTQYSIAVIPLGFLCPLTLYVQETYGPLVNDSLIPPHIAQWIMPVGLCLLAVSFAVVPFRWFYLQRTASTEAQPPAPPNKQR